VTTFAGNDTIVFNGGSTSSGISFSTSDVGIF
jgi:hypothetical protein